MNSKGIFWIEADEIDREMYFSKIPFRSFERDRISQKLNLAHACIEYFSSVVWTVSFIASYFHQFSDFFISSLKTFLVLEIPSARSKSFQSRRSRPGGIATITGTECSEKILKNYVFHWTSCRSINFFTAVINFIWFVSQSSHFLPHLILVNMGLWYKTVFDLISYDITILT